MIKIGGKKAQYYKGILMKADLGLHEQIAREVIRREPPTHQPKILDLGAGEGALSQRLHDLGYSVIAADMDESNYKCENAYFHKIDFNNTEEILQFTTQYTDYFDVVLGIEVIEHVENPWEYIRLLKKMVRPGGTIIVTTPNITSWLSRLIFLLSGQFHQFHDKDLSYGHIAPITKWELEVILRKENLEDIFFQPGGYLPLIWVQRSFKYMLLNAVGIVLRLIMRGQRDGWCIIASCRKMRNESSGSK
ncbi:class I SAM-dependent methyltransferase [Cohnella cellulosilytica]|uniref:Class I SAM-dependent methyltransferase n=1 Tax=Cohnella cellulosilytica TaxID=986710 RepID=A0ABW2FDI5_9BACL